MKCKTVIFRIMRKKKEVNRAVAKKGEDFIRTLSSESNWIKKITVETCSQQKNQVRTKSLKES